MFIPNTPFHYCWWPAAIQCLKRKRLYEQQVEQLGNFQLRIHDQVLLSIYIIYMQVISFSVYWIFYSWNISNEILVSDDNARRCKSYNGDCRCFEKWSSCHEGDAEGHVSDRLSFIMHNFFCVALLLIKKLLWPSWELWR